MKRLKSFFYYSKSVFFLRFFPSSFSFSSFTIFRFFPLCFQSLNPFFASFFFLSCFPLARNCVTKIKNLLPVALTEINSIIIMEICFLILGYLLYNVCSNRCTYFFTLICALSESIADILSRWTRRVEWNNEIWCSYFQHYQQVFLRKS